MYNSNVLPVELDTCLSTEATQMVAKAGLAHPVAWLISNRLTSGRMQRPNCLDNVSSHRNVYALAPVLVIGGSTTQFTALNFLHFFQTSSHNAEGHTNRALSSVRSGTSNLLHSDR